MTPPATPMHLFSMHVQSHDTTVQRDVTVWVQAENVVQARALADTHLAEAGWSVLRIDSESLTTSDDYFRPCPSQQAFVRAQSENVAWRFADE